MSASRRTGVASLGGRVENAGPIRPKPRGDLVSGDATSVLVLDASPGVTSAGYRALSIKALPLVTGAADYYECPADKRALVTIPRIANYAGAARQAIFAVGVSGGPSVELVRYWLNGAVGTTSTQAVMLLLQAGEILTAGADGSDVNVLIGVKEFAAGTNDVVASTVACGAGDNVLFTCPDGYSATLFDDYGELTPGQLLNDGIANATLKLGIIPAGDAVSYLGGPTGSGGFVGAVDPVLVVGRTLSLWGSYAYLGPGDALVLNSDVAGINAHTIWRLWPEP